MKDVRFSLYSNSPEREIGRGWKMSREQLPEAVTLLMRCMAGRWHGRRIWEVEVHAMDREEGVQLSITGLRWPDVQRKWFERHMRKLLISEETTNS